MVLLEEAGGSCRCNDHGGLFLLLSFLALFLLLSLLALFLLLSFLALFLFWSLLNLWLLLHVVLGVLAGAASASGSVEVNIHFAPGILSFSKLSKIGRARRARGVFSVFFFIIYNISGRPQFEGESEI